MNFFTMHLMLLLKAQAVVTYPYGEQAMGNSPIDPWKHVGKNH